jgi:hypothetical protein
MSAIMGPAPKRPACRCPVARSRWVRVSLPEEAPVHPVRSRRSDGCNGGHQRRVHTLRGGDRVRDPAERPLDPAMFGRGPAKHCPVGWCSGARVTQWTCATFITGGLRAGRQPAPLEVGEFDRRQARLPVADIFRSAEANALGPQTTAHRGGWCRGARRPDGRICLGWNSRPAANR